MSAVGYLEGIGHEFEILHGSETTLVISIYAELFLILWGLRKCLFHA